MNRRSFVGSLSATLLTAPYALRGTPYARLSRIGLELYSVRNEMKKDPEATLAAVRAMGYNDVELLWSFNNFERTPEQVRAALEHEGLHAPSGHIAPEALLKNWQKSVDDARFVGSEYLIVPSLPAETNKSLDAWKLWAERFNNAGQIANKAGLWLAFHNEPDHMKPINGQVPLDLFIQWTDPNVVRHQLDVGNMLLGGGDPMRYLTKYKDRYWSFHLKDVTANKKNDTELGKGVFDFKKFLAAIPNLDRKPCYVEQESPAAPMDSAKANYTYLQTLEF
jgi:sugar phosphate isomerase/epimerase